MPRDFATIGRERVERTFRRLRTRLRRELCRSHGWRDLRGRGGRARALEGRLWIERERGRPRLVRLTAEDWRAIEQGVRAAHRGDAATVRDALGPAALQRATVRRVLLRTRVASAADFRRRRQGLVRQLAAALVGCSVSHLRRVRGPVSRRARPSVRRPGATLICAGGPSGPWLYYLVGRLERAVGLRALVGPRIWADFQEIAWKHRFRARQALSS